MVKRRNADLVPVEIVARDVDIEHEPTGSDFDLQLPNGMQFRAPQGFDAGEPRRQVSALRC